MKQKTLREDAHSREAETALGARMCQGTFFFMFHRKLCPMKQKHSHGCMSGAKKDSCQSRCILARDSRKQNIYEGKQN